MSKIQKVRISQLAKELGVTAKDIIEKCKAEDIPGVDKPQATVSVGLALTIREWFGAADAGTAVERAAPVDVEEARARAEKAPRRSRKSATAAGDHGSSDGDTATATAAPPASDEKPAPSTRSRSTRKSTATVASEAGSAVEERAASGESESALVGEVAASATPVAAAPTAPAGVTSTPVVETALSTDQSVPPIGKAHAKSSPGAFDQPPPPAPPPGLGSRPTPPAGPGSVAPGGTTPTQASPRGPVFPPGPAPRMNVPDRPQEIKPVGPMLERPVRTQLSGPRVIRVEQPEQIAAPRPRSAAGPGGPPRTGPRVGRGTDGPGTDDRNRGVGRGGPATGQGARNRRRAVADGPGGRSARAGGGEGEAPFEPWREQDLLERENRLSRSGGFFRAHRRDHAKRAAVPGQRQAPGQPSGPVRVSTPVYIKDLSAATGVKAADILKQLFLKGIVANLNSTLDAEQAMEVMLEFGVEIEATDAKTATENIEEIFKQRQRTDERPRSPIVTILGHVDHGKTSLLDRIRNTNVAAGEAGGITQATSAFRVPVKAGDGERVITFIDTPGHEAFTNMRARGAHVTDIAVLVVAADDGVMPQTIESINHAKAAKVPIVVALNKIDRSEATDNNIQRIFGQLAEHGLNPTEWGGDTEIVRTSATKGTGIQELLDVLDYQAELLGLKADFAGTAVGTVLEAQMEEGRGPVARILVQEGLLKKGNIVVIGRAFGRVRDIVNDRGQRIDEAGPSTPVAISGIDLLPDAGDRFFVAPSLKEAEEAAIERRRVERERELAAPKITLDNVFEHLGKGERKELALVVKGDVQGSVETLRTVLSRIKTDEVAVSVKHCAVGGINESDVALAAATGAIIVGFNVTTSSKARTAAEARKIEIRLYDVIYDLTDDVQKAVAGLLEPELKLEVLGHAEVRQVFRISKVGAVAGCYVTDGVMERNAQIRVTRGGIVVEKDRRLEQLKRFKDDAREVRAGNECGMKIVGYDDIQVGDVLECYRTISVARSLGSGA
ncbi:MAG: translation initiation factor IF-2 [Phycisphaeraceae bacterium]|nr:translation initiation factor IF-2 [Phycisphaeraceae bacterium]